VLTQATPAEVKAFVKAGAQKIASLNSAERSVLFDVLGGTLHTFCIEDQVQFHRKRNSIFTETANEEMVVRED